MIKKLFAALSLAALTALMSGCIIKYSFTGASIHPDAQTFSVAYFANNATYVTPTLSNQLTEALKDRLMRQTRLGQVSEGGDLAFEGEITSDMDAPSAIGADEYATQNRITITVQVRYTNELEPEWNFNRSFSAFADYDANRMRTDVEGEVMAEIVETLVDNIFNASVANW